MHITHLVSSFQFGGPERQILALGERWYPKYDFSILSFSEKGKAKHFIREARNREFPAHVLDNDTPFLLAAKRELIQRLKKLGTQVLYCHGYKANLVGRWAARSLKIPVVAVCRGWTGESLRVKVYERLDKCLLRRMDAVVCVSQTLGRQVHKHGVPLSRLRVIPNMARSNEMEQDRTKARARLLGMFRLIPEDAFIYLAAGRLSPEKGFDLFVEAAAMVRRENPQARFILFGEGKERDKLQRQIAALGLLDVFLLAGFRDTLDDILAGADCVVLSSHTEGMPNILLEAKEVGVPIVATDVGGVGEIVDAESGTLVPSGHAMALSQAMKLESTSPQRKQGRGATPLLALRAGRQYWWLGIDLIEGIPAEPKSITVFFVIDNLARAGTERQLLRLVETLGWDQVRPVLFLLDGEGGESKQLEPHGVDAHRLGIRKLRSIRAGVAAFRFLRLLWKHRPAAAQVYFIDSARFAIPLCRLAGIRNIIHVRNNSGYWLEGGLSRFDQVIARLCRWHLTNNRGSMETWIRKGLQRGRCRTIKNFFPDPVANPTPILQGKVAVIGILANLRPVKNLPMLIRVVVRLDEAGHPVVLKIAGEGPQRRELEEQIHSLGRKGTVQLVGAVDEPMQFLEGIDIGVLCSVSEGSPSALMEYAAAGRAVVSTRGDWVGIAECFGWQELDYCDPDEDSLFRAIESRLNDPNRTRNEASRGWKAYRDARSQSDSEASYWARFYRKMS